MTLKEIKLLHAFNAWANNRIFAVVETMSPEDVTKDMKSSHGSIYGTLVHMVAAEKIWHSRLIGKPEPTMMPPEEAPTLPALKAIWERVGYETAKFVGTLNDKKLQETFTMQTTAGETFTYVYWQAMQHVVDHSSYHGGQIITLMRQQGHTPPSTGLIRFYRETAKLS